MNSFVTSSVPFSSVQFGEGGEKLKETKRNPRKPAPVSGTSYGTAQGFKRQSGKGMQSPYCKKLKNLTELCLTRRAKISSKCAALVHIIVFTLVHGIF